MIFNETAPSIFFISSLHHYVFPNRTSSVLNETVVASLQSCRLENTGTLIGHFQNEAINSLASGLTTTLIYTFYKVTVNHTTQTRRVSEITDKHICVQFIEFVAFNYRISTVLFKKVIHGFTIVHSAVFLRTYTRIFFLIFAMFVKFPIETH